MSDRILDLLAENDETKNFKKTMTDLVIGQESTINQISQVYQIINADIANSIKPIGVFMLMGPTGTGKTHTVEALAKTLMGDRRKFIKINCTEMKLKHSINKVLGAPAGYIGHKTKTTVNKESIAKVMHPSKKFWILLLDEIEKAHRALYQVMMDVFDKAELHDGKNRLIDYSRCIIFMTSNLGVKPPKKIQGFSTNKANDKPSESTQIITKLTGNPQYDEELERRFSPEFLNRIDYFSVFNKLSADQLRSIVKLEVGYIEDRINQSKKMHLKLECTDATLDRLVEYGNNPDFGARPIKRILEKMIVEPFSLFLTTDQIKEFDWVIIDINPEKPHEFIFSIKDTSINDLNPL